MSIISRLKNIFHVNVSKKPVILENNNTVVSSTNTNAQVKDQDNSQHHIKTYSDLDQNIIYCKMVKSSKEIAENCIEPFYWDYNVNQITIDNNKKGNHGFSFVQITSAINVIPYGDTLILLNTKDKLLQHIAVDNVGGLFNEYKSIAIIPSFKESLDNPDVIKLILKNADPYSLSTAILSEKTPMLSIHNHLNKIHCYEALRIWDSTVSKYYELQSTSKSPIDAAKIIQDNISQKYNIDIYFKENVIENDLQIYNQEENNYANLQGKRYDTQNLNTAMDLQARLEYPSEEIEL